MTFIDAESNKSRITCIIIMVVVELDWMRIQNLPNRIGCGDKKKSSHSAVVSSALVCTVAQVEKHWPTACKI